MKKLSEFVEEQNIYENLLEINSNILLEEFRQSLLIWSTFGITSKFLFESSKYHFDYLDDIVNKFFEYIAEKNEFHEEETKIFDFSKYNLFFKKVILKIKLENNLEGGHEKENLNNDTISFELTLFKDKPIEYYSLYEYKRLNYLIIHELCHAYENYLIKQSGNPNGIFYDENSKEYKIYQSSIVWLRSGRNMSKIKKELILCGYFLDTHEKFAYIGTVEKTVKNIFDKIKPTYKDLKFDEILDLFKDEFIWKNYVEIDVFIKSLENNEDDKNLKYKVWRIYSGLYDEEISEDDIIKELVDKWEDFKKEFIEEFLLSYDKCAQTMKLEAFIDPF